MHDIPGHISDKHSFLIDDIGREQLAKKIHILQIKDLNRSFLSLYHVSNINTSKSRLAVDREFAYIVLG